MLSKDGELFLKSKEIANAFNNHFESIVGLDCRDGHSLSPRKGSDRIDNIIKRYKNHPSIKNIEAKFNSFRSFLFQSVFMDKGKTVSRDMKNNRYVGEEISIQILKGSEFTFEILTNCINKSIEIGCFPDNLKEANITPIFKKKSSAPSSAPSASNYKPISILPLISKE